MNLLNKMKGTDIFTLQRTFVCPCVATCTQFLRSLVRHKSWRTPCPLTQKMPLQGKYVYSFGFMLLEAMVALAILSVGIVTVMQSFSSALRVSKTGYNSTIATFLAQSKLSDLEREGSWTKENLSGDFGKVYPNFKWEAEVSPVELDKLIPENLRVKTGEEKEEGEGNKQEVNLLNLTVSWIERGVEEEAVFATYINARE